MTTTTPRQFRCAAYVRVSTDEQATGDYTSLDAQRDACEAYIRSQQHDGWVVLPTPYNDTATGKNTKRAGIQGLLTDMRAGLVDVIVVYKFDRLSRSMLDFLQLIKEFDERNVVLVSVSQKIDTSGPTGRLFLQILAAFGEFERELISGRTKDKMQAMRKRGTYIGGMIPLGYNLDPQTKKLVVNPEEAIIVRELFRLYLERQGLVRVVTEAHTRGWHTKRWVTKTGKLFGGAPFNKLTLRNLLTNLVYVGKVQVDGVEFDGDHEAILGRSTFDAAQEILQGNAGTQGRHIANRHPEAILKGLLRCGDCGKAMTHVPTRKSDGTTYRYYRCITAQKAGAARCPSGSSLPATEIEQFVVDRLRTIADDPEQVDAIARDATALATSRLQDVQTDIATWEARVNEQTDEITRLRERLAQAPAHTRDVILSHLQALEEQQTELVDGLERCRNEAAGLTAQRLTPRVFRAALTYFDPVWNVLYPQERARIVQLLIESVEYTGSRGSLSLAFRPSGVLRLAHELEEATHA
ncbi:MAG: recombinase family protein [Armatimonadota bacterium]